LPDEDERPRNGYDKARDGERLRHGAAAYSSLSLRCVWPAHPAGHAWPV